MSKLYSLDLEKIVRRHFEKKYYFCPQLCDWKLPEPTEMFVARGWKVDRLQMLKDELKILMRRVDTYDKHYWRDHTRSIDKASYIKSRQFTQLNPEVLTDDWCKFYEIATYFNLIPPASVLTHSLNSVHLCETSGSFITSVNHYMKVVYKSGIEWKWLETTRKPQCARNPSSRNIDDYIFILKTVDRWNFGLDDTGNIIDINNVLYILKGAVEMVDVLLVTANGSIDCPENSAEHESASSALHYCEAVLAMHILAKGGSLILKMSTMYEHQSMCLMYLLCYSFNAVRVCKPATSNEGDSEVYVVCLKYRGIDFMEPWLEVLREHYGPKVTRRAMFPPESFPQDFVYQFYKCTTMFHNTQTTVMKRNIWYYETNITRDEDVMIKKLKCMAATHFMEVHEIRSLSESEKLLCTSYEENEDAECWE
jgi:cap2 methyltransferase